MSHAGSFDDVSEEPFPEEDDNDASGKAPLSPNESSDDDDDVASGEDGAIFGKMREGATFLDPSL